MSPTTESPKIMLGFVVRQCAVALGHRPSPTELVEWANNQGKGRQRHCLFGRPITIADARVILRHPGRPVTVRSIPFRPRAVRAPRASSDGRRSTE
jgi:hypothetical protein